jgi:single-stranded-DNA-specific exonuclease
MLETMAMIARAGPFGAGNAEPIVAFPHHTVVYADTVGQNHVRVRLKGGDGAFVNAIAFRAAGQKLGIALMESRGRAVHAAGCLSLDRWQGEERVQIAHAGPGACRRFFAVIRVRGERRSGI